MYVSEFTAKNKAEDYGVVLRVFHHEKLIDKIYEVHDDWLQYLRDRVALLKNRTV